MGDDPAPDYEAEDRDAGAPFELVIPDQAASDNALRLLDRLQADYGYGVCLEYRGEATSVYTVTPGFADA